jgi:hypothetical protein
MPTHAFDPTSSNPIQTLLRRCATRIAPLVAAAFLAAPMAGALEGIDLTGGAEPAAEGDCPRLVQIKYPFLSCPGGQIGQSGEDDSWEGTRHIPGQSEWTEGDGYWGPSLNVE